MKGLLLLLIFLLLSVSFIIGQIIHVPGEQPTIQAGIDAATDGDTVLVADGVYTGNGNTMLGLDGKDIVVKSQKGPINCIIDGQGTDYIGFGDDKSYNGLNTVIEGFTIRDFNGPGFYYYNGACPTIRNNIVESCNSGGITSRGGSSIIENNIIRNNGGPGIECSNSTARINSNTISGNYASSGAGINLYGSAASVINNILSDNIAETSGGGIYASKDASRIINNTIVNNLSPLGAGIYSTLSNQILTNNIVAFSKGYIPIVEDKLWKSVNTTATFIYNHGVLIGARILEGFVNKGEACNVTIAVGDYPDTTIFVQSYETYSLEIVCGIYSSGYSTLTSIISSDTDTLYISASLGDFLVSGVSSIELTSNGIDVPPPPPFGGFVASECDTTIIKNCNFYGNDGGGYFNDGIDTSEIDLTDIDGNLTSDPLFNKNDYSLAAGSPCIDNGISDTTGLFLPSIDMNGAPRIMDGDENGSLIIDIGAYEFNPTKIGIKDIASTPSNFNLEQNYPNPFNPSTTFKYEIPKESYITLKVYDILGREVATLVNKQQKAGYYEVDWNAVNNSSGIYFYKIQAGDFVETKKMIFMK